MNNTLITSKLKDWGEYYCDRVNNNEYENKFKIKYDYFLKKISNKIKFNNIIISEYGCGIGSIYKALTNSQYIKFKYKYRMFDNNISQLKSAKENLSKINKYEYEIDYADILKPYNNFSDIIVGHGVLEHFSDYKLDIILKNQSKNANVVIHYVPSDKYNYRSYGDERLLSIDKWSKIFKKHFNNVEVTTFNNELDICIVAN